MIGLYWTGNSIWSSYGVFGELLYSYFLERFVYFKFIGDYICYFSSGKFNFNFSFIESLNYGSSSSHFITRQADMISIYSFDNLKRNDVKHDCKNF